MEAKITIKYADSCNKMMRVHDVITHEYHAEDKTITLTFQRETAVYLATLASDDSAIAARIKKGSAATPATIKESAREHLKSSEYGRRYAREDAEAITNALVEEFKAQGIHY